MSAHAQGDKTTFRITRIPEEYDQERLSQAIEHLFSLGRSDFRVHSLASDASYEEDPQRRIATISFRTRPELLEESSAKAGEWQFDVQSSQTDHSAPLHEPTYIYFDLHFHGFTPLSLV